MASTIDSHRVEESYESIRQRWDGIRIANIYDALEKLGHSNQCLDLGIRPFEPTRHVAGVAVTIRGVRDPVDYDEDHQDMEHIFHGSPNVHEFLFPGSVLVVDGGGEEVSGKMGEMTCWSFRQRGACGVVVDGYIRDRLGLDVIDGFTVCARGTSPIESNRRWHIDAVNVPIVMPGTLTAHVAVRPGDWIIGGDDGVIVVPQEIAPVVLPMAEDIERREAGMRDDLARGLAFAQAYDKWGRA